MNKLMNKLGYVSEESYLQVVRELDNEKKKTANKDRALDKIFEMVKFGQAIQKVSKKLADDLMRINDEELAAMKGELQATREELEHSKELYKTSVGLINLHESLRQEGEDISLVEFITNLEEQVDMNPEWFKIVEEYEEDEII